MRPTNLLAIVLLLCFAARPATAEDSLPGTAPLDWTGELDVRMRAGLHRFLDTRTQQSPERRASHWQRDFSNESNYLKSIEPNRARFKKYIGAVDTREKPAMLGAGGAAEPALVASMPGYTVREVRWPVFAQPVDKAVGATVKQSDWPDLPGPTVVEGEGLLLQPAAKPRGYIVVAPDSDQTPEQVVGLAPGVAAESQFARRLVENGYVVVVPTLLSRGNEFSCGVHVSKRNHRDWIYTPAFELGRHPIGYEVQKVQAAIDWFEQQAAADGASDPAIAVAGYGEGGLIAFYAAAIDTRIDAALISGYFGPREQLWQEPLHRNVWGLLDAFGDAEIATLIAPRSLVVEYSRGPEITFDPAISSPGKLTPPPLAEVEREFARIGSLLKPGYGSRELIVGTASNPSSPPVPAAPGSANAIQAFLKQLGNDEPMAPLGEAPADNRRNYDFAARQQRTVEQLSNFTQRLLRNSEYERDATILPQLAFDSVAAYETSAAPLREEFRREHVGWLEEPLLKNLNPRSRKIYDEPKWTGYEVVLDVFPDVFAWGILCVPKDIAPDERRPVVVCQHGLEGLPRDTIDQGASHQYYKSFAGRLAEAGYVTFAPHNFYRGQTDFRLLQRKLNPLKASLFSILVPQHSQILNFLETLPFVDKQRIGFYGLSYGGKSAMRIPALETRYCLSICSADFNEWVRKNADIYFSNAYPHTPEWEMPEWDLGHSFNYAEMAALICPRPFMVERGHHDGVGIDPWVAYEYARVERVYNKLGRGDDCRIEFFDGPHTINLVGTAEFLQQHLGWPAK